MTYRVKIDVFEGPFDLLLHLVAKRDVDIYEVSLAQITEDYLTHLQQMAELDLEIATEFLVVAATLIEMKASRLLPGPPRDDDDDALSDRDLLIVRLLEYGAFKEAAATLRRLAEDNAGFFARDAGPGAEFAYLCPDLMARTSPDGLAALAARLLSPKPKRVIDVSHITPIRASVTEAAETIRTMLERIRRGTFDQLAAGAGSRIERIVRFLAVLELLKAGEVDVTQTGSFGEIAVAWRGRTAARIDEYEPPPADEPSITIHLDAGVAAEDAP